MRRRAKGQGRSAAGLILIGAVMLALAGFAAAGVLLRPPPTDAETLCRTDAPLQAHTIVLIDSTDRLEARHRRKLEAVLDQERARLGQYERLTLLRLNARDAQEPRVLFSKCLPRPPDQTNPLFENPRMAQEHWDAAFANALESAVRSAQRGGAGRASPLLSGVRAAAAEPAFAAQVPRRRLVIVSDMMEHEPGVFSLYAADATYAQWRAANASGPADLANVDVRLAPLDRPEHAARQEAALTQFWENYLDDSDAKSVSIDAY